MIVERNMGELSETSYSSRRPTSVSNAATSETGRVASPRERFIQTVRSIWPIVIELWMLAILLAFFVIRVMNSNLGRTILAKLVSGHLL